jgi:hypothetical protein
MDCFAKIPVLEPSDSQEARITPVSDLRSAKDLILPLCSGLQPAMPFSKHG